MWLHGRICYVESFAEPPRAGNGLGIFVPHGSGDDNKHNAAAEDTSTESATVTSTAASTSQEKTGNSEILADSSNQAPDPSIQGSRTNVLSINSLLSTNLPATVSAPITPLATPPTTPTLKTASFMGSREDLDSRCRMDTACSELSATSWSDSLFGPDD